MKAKTFSWKWRRGIHIPTRAFGVAVLGLLFIIVQPVEAERVYRCYGRVQYRPCEAPPLGGAANTSIFGQHEFAKPQVSSARIARNIQPLESATSAYARIEGPSLSKAASSPRDGVWRGTVHGNGVVYLYLEILEKEQLSERRFIGNVALERAATTFAFVSRLPSGSQWTWRVRALASPFT